MKTFIRIASLCLALVLMGLAVLIVWQPDALKRKLLDYGLEIANRQTPYMILVGDVRGNVFRTLSLHDVRVLVKRNAQRVAHVDRLDIKLAWAALRQRRLEISSVVMRKPTIQLKLDAKNRPLLPARGPGQKGGSGLAIHQLVVRDGVLQLAKAGHADLIFAPVQAKARLGRDGVELQTFRIGLGSGIVRGRGTIVPMGGPSGSLSWTTERIAVDRLARWFGAAPAALRLVHSGQWQSNFDKGEWTLSSSGRLNERPFDLDLRSKAGDLSGRLVWNEVSIAGLGFAQFQNQFVSTRLEFANVGAGVTGADLEGTLDLYQAHGEQPWARAELRVDNGRGRLKTGIELDGVQASAGGDIDLVRRGFDGQWQLDAHHYEQLARWFPAIAQLQGHLTGHGRVHVTRGKNWKASGDVQAKMMRWQEQQLEKASLRLDLDSAGTSRVRLTGENLQRGRKPAPLDARSFTVDLEFASGQPWQAALVANFRNDAMLQASTTAERVDNVWECVLSQLDIAVPGQNSPWRLAHKKGRLQVGPDQIVLRDFELIRQQDYIRIPQGQFQKGRVSGRMRADFDPALFNVFLDDAIEPGGQLHAQLQAQSAGPDNRVTGTIEGGVPRVRVEGIGADLRDLRFALQFATAAVHIQTLTAKMKKGELHGSGQIVERHLDLRVQSKGFAIDTESRKAKADVDVRIGGMLDAPDITGNIVLARGVFDYGKERKKNKEKKAAEAAPPTEPSRSTTLWTKTRVDIVVQWDRDVWYRDGLTGIETQGDLRIQKARGAGQLALTGQIRSLQGRYAFYGKEFEIESGLVQFTGPPEINPLLNIQAVYESDPTLIYLTVTGTMKTPVLKMNSIPPLPDQDIVSILVFGRPLRELNTTMDGGTNQDMASIAGSVLGSYLTKELRETGIEHLNLDVLNVESTAQGNQVTLGRYVTRNLFVSYGQTLSSTGSRGFAADYYLGKHWVVEGSAGSPTMSYLDVLFRFPLNASDARGAAPVRQSPFRNTLDRPDLMPSAVSSP